MKTLVAYYSRTGRTKKIAEAISNNLSCDIEEIIDTAKRSGPFGLFLSRYQAAKKKLTVLQEIRNDPALYDLVIIGTPVWTNTISTPIRTYIHQNKSRFKNVAFFCTFGGIGFEDVFSEMEELCGKKPVNVLPVEAIEVLKDNYMDKVKKFVDNILK
jgi:flavodoxin